MASRLLARHSLKTRITVTTLAVFLVGIWSLAFDAGMDDVIVKPFDPEQLFATPLRWLDAGAAGPAAD